MTIQIIGESEFNQIEGSRRAIALWRVGDGAIALRDAIYLINPLARRE